jgi:hypothetical protein
MERSSENVAFHIPSLIVGVAVGAAIAGSAFTMAPRGFLYALGIRNITDSVYLLFWLPFLCVSMLAVLAGNRKIRNTLAISLVVLTILNVAGCVSEIVHEIN